MAAKATRPGADVQKRMQARAFQCAKAVAATPIKSAPQASAAHQMSDVATRTSAPASLLRWIPTISLSTNARLNARELA